jgi:hypothetical protein
LFKRAAIKSLSFPFPENDNFRTYIRKTELTETATSVCLLHIYLSVYVYTELTENGNFHLLAANGKQRRQTSVCLLQTENRDGKLPRLFSANRNGKRKFVFLGWQTINVN